MTDWGEFVQCDVCKALKGEACRSLSSGGPGALPGCDLAAPHSSRKKAANSPRKVPVERARKSTSAPVRRAARRTASTADAWRALADKQNRRRA